MQKVAGLRVEPEGTEQSGDGRVLSSSGGENKIAGFRKTDCIPSIIVWVFI